MTNNQPHSPHEIRPLFRPFVIRPTLWMAATSLAFMLAYFAIWDSVFLVLGNAAWAGPLLLVALPLLMLAARTITYRGTHYAIGKDRILVHHGGVFGDRSVELDLVNITLVEWRSPYLLKLLYGVGHLVIQEAGSANQNARLVYIEEPERIYRLIAENMRQQGFSMQRNARICRQKSGVLGALVDMLGFGAGLVYAGVLMADTLAFSFGRIATNIASSLRPVVEQVESTEYIVSTFIFVLSGLALIGLSLAMVFKFVELSRRTLTLHDDVVDYYQGFLSEKRQFIPLENLTDTELLRPLYKRLLGLSDLRLSSRGAGSNLMFNSMPGAEEFAGALEAQLDATRALKDPDPAERVDSGAPTQPDDPPPARTVEPHTFKPAVGRAAAGSLLSLLVLPLIIFVGMGLFAGLGALGVGDLGTIGAGIFGSIAIWGGLWLVSTIFGIGRSVLYARATEYSFDGRRARKTFDFLNRQETKFAVEQVTSFSILTNPIDRVLGTMTLRLRSIGSAEALDFKHIAEDPALIAGLEEALGFKQAAGPVSAPREAALTPRFTLLEGLRAHIAGFLGMGVALLVSALFVGLVVESWGVAVGICVGALLVGFPIYMLWQSLRVGRLSATLGAETVSVQGGVWQHYRHCSAYRHIKGVNSVQYPGSGLGELNIATGGGFTMRIDFLPGIRVQHARIDSLVLERPMTPDIPADRVAFQPNIKSELTRHMARFTLFIITIPTLPLSLAWVALRTRRTQYRLESDRIFVEVPLVFHRRTSVLFERIDHLESSRDMANKLYDTRDIEVYTVGSSTVDLTLRAIKAHQRVLRLIRERMGTEPTQRA